MFEHWDSFYILIGSASGALIGLLFVVATLQTGRDPDEASRGASIYLTPTVFHFAIVLVISAMASVPGLGPRIVGSILAVCAAAGLVHAARITRYIRSAKTVPAAPHWTDFWCYGAVPGVAYLGLLASAVAAWTSAVCAAYLIAVSLLVLLLISIRNAWDLVTWLAPRAPRP